MAIILKNKFYQKDVTTTSVKFSMRDIGADCNISMLIIGGAIVKNPCVLRRKVCIKLYGPIFTVLKSLIMLEIPATKPNGENTTPLAEETSTTQSVEKNASTKFSVSHYGQGYSCTFEFSYSIGKGIQINIPLSSSCSKSTITTESVKFLEKYEFNIVTSDEIELVCSLSAVFEKNDDQIKLVENVVKQSLQCSPTPGVCLTEGRFANNKPLLLFVLFILHIRGNL